jgi:uroporphyrinogen decarboxylase
MNVMIREPYTREQVRAVVERVADGGAEGAAGRIVPLTFHKWWGEGTYAKYGTQLDDIGCDIPDDVPPVSYVTPGDYTSPTADENYRWAFSGSPSPSSGGLDERVLLPDWRDVDAYMAQFPDIDRQTGLFDATRSAVATHPGQYVLGHWWYCFYERLWAIRGMQNVLVDFIEHPVELKRLSRAILDHHVKAIRGLKACGVDGIFTSDDLGSQRALMMSPATFRKFLKPLYAEIIAETHSLGMHFWLHACGNIQAIIPDFIEIGLDVIHPIQAHTMDYAEISERFGGRISFLVGMDVQHLLPTGTTDEVRAAVRDVAHTFGRPNGGLLLAAGNGIMPETPLANIRAFLEEATRL